LWDFQANVDGARVLYEGLRPILLVKNKALATAIDTELSKLQALLNSHKQGAGFVYYDQLSTSQVRALSDQVNALAERLNELTAALVS
jgi:iron uptake system component EfeO